MPPKVLIWTGGDTEIKHAQALCIFYWGSDQHFGNYHMSKWQIFFLHGHKCLSMLTISPVRKMAAWVVALSVHCLFPEPAELARKSKKFPVLLLFCVEGIFLKLDPWAAASCTKVLQWHRFSTQMYNFFQTVLFPPGEISRIISNIPFSLTSPDGRVALSPADAVVINTNFYTYTSSLSM